MNGVGSGGPSDTKIGNLDLTFRGDNDILWLDIPMDNALIGLPQYRDLPEWRC